MKHVFHIISHFDMGGAERVAVNIAKSGNPDIEYHIVELIRTRSKFSSAFIGELKKAGIRYHRSIVPGIRFHYLFERFAAVTFPLRYLYYYLRYRPGAVHCHTEMPDLGVYLAFTIMPWLIWHCEVVRTIHNTRLWTGMKKTGLKVEDFFMACSANVGISESVCDSYEREYGERPSLIYNGVGQVPRKPYKDIVPGKKNILFAGRFEPQKGMETLIKIIRARRDDDRYFFHVVGNGSLRKRLKSALEDCQNVRIVPPIYGLAAYLPSFDYMLMPSEFEGLSIMSIEASMAALPVIANNCPGLRDTLPPDWQLKVENNDLDAYNHIFDTVIPAVDARKLGDEAQRFAEENFSIERMQRSYENRY